LTISKIEIGAIDFLKDTAILNVYYDSKETNFADTLTRKNGNSTDDDD